MTTFIKTWGPVLAWMTLIFWLSSIPHLEVTHEPVGNFLTRKTGHLIEYSVLALLIFRAQGYTQLTRAITLASIYGVSDEFHQNFVPSRTALPTDIGFDVLGASLGGLLWQYLPTRLKKLRL